MNACDATIYDKLIYINETKQLIKAAIEANDVEVLESDTFRKYAEYIADIQKVKSVNGKKGDVIVQDVVLTLDEYNDLLETDEYTSYFIIQDDENK